MDWTPLSERSPYPQHRTRPPREKRYLDGLWLYAPNVEVLAPPYLDYLIENFNEDSRQEITAGVTRYHFHNQHGTIRVTTDDPREEGGVSARWLHAATQEDLFQLAKKASWCCDLPAKLQHRTKVAEPVLGRLRASRFGC